MKKSLFIILLIIANLYAFGMPSYAAGNASKDIDIRITGNGSKDGTIEITKPDGTTDTIPEEGSKDADKMLTYTFSLTGVDVGEKYDYVIKQLAGSDSDTIYDTSTTYTVRAHVVYPPKDGVYPETTTPEGEPAVSEDYEPDYSKYDIVFEIREEGETTKPTEISFKNEFCEIIVIKRRITYTEITPDGKVVHTPVEQSVTLKRIGGGPWNVVPESSTTVAVESKDHPKKASEGWKPNLDNVPEWKIERIDDPNDPNYHSSAYCINLSDPNLKNIAEAHASGGAFVIHVVYNKPKPQTVTSYEYMTVTRYITYTEYTPDGKTVSVTVKQIVKLRRTRIDYLDASGNIIPGKTTYSRWEIVDGDISAVGSPPYPGWKPDKDKVGEWKIDLDNPQDEYIHVVYTPSKGGKDIIKEFVNTSDPTAIGIWVATIIIAVILMIDFRRRRRQKTK